MTTTKELLSKALVSQGGYTPDTAELTVNDFIRVIENGDSSAYRELADAVISMIHETDDPDDWDGETSELDLLVTFVQWEPDLIAHKLAEKIRTEWIKTRTPGQWAVAEKIADGIDPFTRNPAGQWVRKTDGAPVPWPVVKD
jgi:hypothetical protein